MGVEIASLYWKAKLDLTELNKDLIDARQKINQGTASIQKETKDGFGKMFAFLGGMFAAVFSAKLVGQFLGVVTRIRGEFQKYEAVLTNTLGSGSKAQEALNNIQQFASKTPFQITELTSSFVKLANQGFTPTIEELRKMGDFASAVGKGFDQLTEAVLDAATGQWERMKEFGVKAQQEGDKVTVTFKGQKTTIDNTAESIRNYILGLGDMKGVAGSMAAISKTLEGQGSNLKDNIDGLLNTIGKKSQGVISGFLSMLNKAIGGLNKLISGDYGDTTGKGIKAFRENLSKELGQINVLFEAAKKSATGTKERKDAIDQINSIYGEYLDNLLTEKSSLDDINTAQTTLIQNIIKTLAVKAQEQQLQKELNKSFEKEQSQFEGLMKYIEKKQGVGTQMVAQNEMNALIEQLSRTGQIDMHGLGEWMRKYDLVIGGRWSPSEIIDRMQEVVAIQRKRQSDIGRINSFYQDLVSGAGRVVGGEDPKNPADGGDEPAEDPYAKELESFKDVLEEMKKMYTEYENFKKVFGEKKAKEMYPNLYNSFAEYLENVYTLVRGKRGEMAIVAEMFEGLNGESIELNRLKLKEIHLSNQKKLSQDIASKMKEQLELMETQLSMSEKIHKTWVNVKGLLQSPETWDSAARGLSELSQAFKEVDEGLSATLSNFSDIAGHMASLLEGIRSKNSIQVFSSGISVFAELFKNVGDNSEQMAKMQQAYEEFQELLRAQIDLIDELVGAEKLQKWNDTIVELDSNIKNILSTKRSWNIKGQKEQTLIEVLGGSNLSDAEVYANLIKQISETEKNLAYAREHEKDSPYSARAIPIEKENLNQLNMLLDSFESRKELMREFYSSLTGTTAGAISDSIRDGFEQGLDSVADFGDKTSDIIRTAIMQAFQTNILDKQLTAWYDQFAKDLQDGATKEEYDRNKAALETIIANSTVAFEEYKKMMEELGVWNSKTGAEAKGMAGAIKGVTEDTAGLIEGQMGAIRINVLEQLEVAKIGLEYQKETAINTRQLERLGRIENYLAGIARYSNISSDRAYGR